MTSNTTPQKKLRAVFLASLMVLSVFLGSVAFSGAVAAAANNGGNASSLTIGVGNSAQSIDGIVVDTTGNVAINVSPLQNNDADLSAANVQVDANEGGVSNPRVNAQDGFVNVTVDSLAGDVADFDVDITNINTTGASTASGLTYTVTDVNADDSATATTTQFSLVGSTGVTADNVDVTVGETNAYINVSHVPDRPSEVQFALYQDGARVLRDNTGMSMGSVTAVDESVSGYTNFTVNLTNSAGQAFELGNYSVYAAAKSSNTNFGQVTDSNYQAEDSFSVNGLEVTSFEGADGPIRVAANDTALEYEVIVKNTGSQQVTQNVSIVSTNKTLGLTDGINNDESVVAQKEVTVDAGANKTVSLELNTGNLNNASENVTNYELAGYTSGSPYSAETAELLVGSSAGGSLTLQVVNQNSNLQEGIQVNLYLEPDLDSGPIIATKTTGDQGRVTFNDLAVGGSNANQVRYVAEAAAQTPEFESTTTTLGLYEPTQTSDSSTVTLRSALEPQNISIAAFQNGEVTGNISTLLADGRVDNTATHVVYTQTQSNNLDNQPINQEVSVDLSTASADGSGLDIARFVDNAGNDAGKTLTVTIDSNSPTFMLDGESYSYTTFRVSAEGATETNMTSAGGTLYPTVLNALQGDAGTDVANDATAAAEVQYVLEGNEAITGEVVNRQGEPVEGAMVWAAYNGSNQSLAFSQNTFVTDDGEAFLVDETNADGRYALPGLAGDNTNVTVYVQATGYNHQNLTSSSVNAYVAASDEEQTAGVDAQNENHDFVLSPVDVTVEYRLTLDIEQDDEGTFGDSASIPVQNQRDVRVQLEVKSQTEPDSAFQPIENSTLVNAKDVDFSMTGDTAIGSLADDPLTVSESGQTTVFTATRSTGTATITANVSNEEGTVFTDSVQVEVFGVGAITGQMINDDTPAENLPNAQVTLYRVNETTGQETQVRPTIETGSQGSFSFTEVRTGNLYRVVGEFNGATGFTEVNKTSAGTSNADVVIVGVSPDPASFNIANVEPAANVTAPAGSTIPVNATIENNGDEVATKDVSFVVDGTVVATQSLELNPGVNETITFDVTVPDTAGDYTWYVETPDDTSDEYTLTVEENNNSPGLARFDTNGNNTIDQGEVINAIDAYYGDQQIGGEEVTDNDVIAVINAYYSGTAV